MKWDANSFGQLWLGVLIFTVAVDDASAAQKKTVFSVSSETTELLESYCFSCHDADSKKGGIRLDNLEVLALKDRLNLLNKMQEQLYLKEMPPSKKKAQPSDTERQQLYQWVSVALGKHNAS